MRQARCRFVGMVQMAQCLLIVPSAQIKMSVGFPGKSRAEIARHYPKN